MYENKGDWLKEADLQGKSIKVEIAGVGIEEIGDKKEEKIVLDFKGKEKKLVLNKTNANVIADSYGDNELKWIGEEIIMYPTVTEYQGKPTPCIRVRVDMPIVEGNEEIPF